MPKKKQSPTPAKPAKRVAGVKGFDRNLQCRGFQYELGKTFTHDGPTILCSSGLHFVEDPLDVFSYYDHTQRFAAVEGEDVSDQKESDSKRVAKTLHIGAELSIRSLIDMGVKFAVDKVDFSKADGQSISKGSSSTAASSGNYSTAASSGNSSKAASSGNYSTAEAKGKNTIAMVAGLSGCASAGENGCFALPWNDGMRVRIITGYVGEDGIQPDTFYRVIDGKLAKA